MEKDIIYARGTASGKSALNIIRISGKGSLKLANSIFTPLSGKKVTEYKGQSLIYGQLHDNGDIIDECLLSVFRGPHSYTGEDSIELSLHGSEWIISKCIKLLSSKGLRMAEAGEYTMRAFVNGKLDLSQAEAVNDLINSHSDASHNLALKQLKGGVSNAIAELRDQLLHFGSLLELELDFSEEDVEFVDRNELLNLLTKIEEQIKRLIKSYDTGNAIKEGISVVITGAPNAGKSTLLNCLLDEDRAIVSEIAGTTRDSIEETMLIDDKTYRFIDTAGLRQSEDTIEKIGIERAYKKLEDCQLILHVLDAENLDIEQEELIIKKIKETAAADTLIINILNKSDISDKTSLYTQKLFPNLIKISAKENIGIEELKEEISSQFRNFGNEIDVAISNQRQLEALKSTLISILEAKKGINMEIPSDLVAIDIKNALYTSGSVTGNISDTDILKNIFGSFCIGK